MSMEPSTVVSEEVLRLFPNPKPVTGCNVCTRAYGWRLKFMNRTSRDYNPGRAAEMSHVIRAHPHGE
jgi:hypothetical protein